MALRRQTPRPKDMASRLACVLDYLQVHEAAWEGKTECLRGRLRWTTQPLFSKDHDEINACSDVSQAVTIMRAIDCKGGSSEDCWIPKISIFELVKKQGD